MLGCGEAGCVLRMPDRWAHACPMTVCSCVLQCLLTAAAARPGQEAQLPWLMAAIYVCFAGQPAAPPRKATSSPLVLM